MVRRVRTCSPPKARKSHFHVGLDTSKWVNETIAVPAGFAWQEGYGAFTIGVSQVDRTVAYIERQAEHHQKQTFQAEFIQFLETHGIEYDPRFIWG